MRLTGRSTIGAALAASCVLSQYSATTASSSAASSSSTPAAPTIPAAAGAYALEESPGAQLRLVQVVFRHGARTPLSRYSDFWKNEPEWGMCPKVPPYKGAVNLDVVSTQGKPNPVSEHNLNQMARKMPGGCFAGELTDLGHNQALALGQHLRRRYMDELKLLEPSFSAGTVVSRTTNFDRTMKTLQGVLSGLYPGCPQPMPVVTSSDLDEILFADSKMCPHLGTFLKLGKEIGKAAIAKDPESAWAKAEMKRVLGLDDKFFEGSWANIDVFDAMTSMKAHGKKLPEGMTDELLAVVNRLATAEFQAFVAPSINDEHGKSVMRLSMGVLLHTLVTNMEQAVERSKTGEQGPSMYLYSGHDSTIMPLLTALGVNVTDWPPYLSNLVFELWQLPDGHHVVRVQYNMQDLQIPHCVPGKHPSLAKFTREVVGSFLLSASEWGAACQVQVDHEQAAPTPMAVPNLLGEEDE